jgi:hypothetical protein
MVSALAWNVQPTSNTPTHKNKNTAKGHGRIYPFLHRLFTVFLAFVRLNLALFWSVIFVFELTLKHYHKNNQK